MRERGFILYFVLFAIAVVTLAVGMAYFQMRSNPHKDEKIQSIIKVNQLPTPTPQDLPKSHLQELLGKHCSKNDPSMRTNDLPILINQSIIQVEKIIVECAAGYSKAYATIYFDNKRLFIYDDFSEELGHGGVPYLGSEGTPIIETRDIKITFYLSGGSGGHIVGESSVVGRGEKKIFLSSGQIIYVNFSEFLIKEDDPRLVKLLKKYAESLTEDRPEELYINKEGYDKDIFTNFFSNLSKTEKPEKENITYIEKILNAVESK